MDFDIPDPDSEQITEKAKGLIPWLPDPHECECGTYCESDVEYVGQMAEYSKVWVCPECGNRYFRERA